MLTQMMFMEDKHRLFSTPCKYIYLLIVLIVMEFIANNMDSFLSAWKQARAWEATPTFHHASHVPVNTLLYFKDIFTTSMIR